jgi:hypothetical protein
VVALVATKVDTVVVVSAAVVKAAKPATPVADTDTCQETAPRAKSATTVAKLDI